MKFLNYPTDDYRLFQPFGDCFPTVCEWYKSMGIKGHNGLDIVARTYTLIRAAHTGTVTMARIDHTGGLELNIVTEDGQYISVYYHLYWFAVKVGEKVQVGDVIGLADNTGKYTTGSHLHFGLYEARPTSYGGYEKIHRNNGYNGAIDPEPFFTGMTAKDQRTFVRVLTKFHIDVKAFMKKLYG